jgi:hypothetical protein
MSGLLRSQKCNHYRVSCCKPSGQPVMQEQKSGTLSNTVNQISLYEAHKSLGCMMSPLKSLEHQDILDKQRSAFIRRLTANRLSIQETAMVCSNTYLSTMQYIMPFTAYLVKNQLTKLTNQVTICE